MELFKIIFWSFSDYNYLAYSLIKKNQIEAVCGISRYHALKTVAFLQKIILWWKYSFLLSVTFWLIKLHVTFRRYSGFCTITIMEFSPGAGEGINTKINVLFFIMVHSTVISFEDIFSFYFYFWWYFLKKIHTAKFKWNRGHPFLYEKRTLHNKDTSSPRKWPIIKAVW